MFFPTFSLCLWNNTPTQPDLRQATTILQYELTKQSHNVQFATLERTTYSCARNNKTVFIKNV